MLENISYYLIFGKPLIMYLGISALLSLLATATLGYLTFKGKTKIPFAWHPRLATITITLALIHATLGILSYF